MKMWLCLVFLLLALSSCEAPAPAGPPADFSGEWAGKVEAPLSNETAAVSLKLEQDGSEIKGKVRLEAIVFNDKQNEVHSFTGTVRGEQATFTFSSEFLNEVMGGPETGEWEFSGKLVPQQDGKNHFDGGAKIKGATRSYAFALFPKKWDRNWE